MLQGFCYVYYSHADAAAAAMDHLNGMEFPPNTGHRLKVGLYTLSHLCPTTLHGKVIWRCTEFGLWLLKCGRPLLYADYTMMYVTSLHVMKSPSLHGLANNVLHSTEMYSLDLS